jgi:hypothetical protein
MTAFNIVRFRVKPGREQDFLAAHKAAERGFPGMRRFVMVKTGERGFCVVGEWDSFDRLAAARPGMIAVLDSFRDTLEDLGGGLGVTDPVAGDAVMEVFSSGAPRKAAGPRKRAKTAKKAKKVPAKKPAKKAARKRAAKKRKR